MRIVRIGNDGQATVGRVLRRCARSAARQRPYRLLCWAQSAVQEFSMGKYIIAWILGVPVIVLVVAYFLFR